MIRIKEKVLLTPENFEPSFKSWRIDGVFNPAAIRLPNKKIFLYVRVAESSRSHRRYFKRGYYCPMIAKKDINNVKVPLSKIKIATKQLLSLKSGLCLLRNISHFREVILDKTGFEVEEISQQPNFTGTPDEGNYGVEDPRIVKIKDKYLMSYVSVSFKTGISTSLAISKDLKKWERKGIIFREQNKDVVLFPEKIKKKYVALHRPESFLRFIKPSIWISYSKDLIYWGKENVVLQPRENSWEEKRIGSGPPPIKTKKGWLLIYHGVHKKQKKSIYSAGAVLLDLKNPEKVLARTPKDKPLLKPEKKYEKKGFINNVIFPTGAVVDTDKKHLLLYSGAGDRVVTVKKILIQDILNSLKYSEE